MAGSRLARLEVVLHLLEDPGLADGSTPDHHGIDAVGVEGTLHLFARGDVTIADDRDVHAGILLHLADERPVGRAGVHLGAGTAVDGEGLDAHVLEGFGELDDDLTIVVPAEAGLHGDGDLHGLDDLADDMEHDVGAAKHTATSALASDTLDGAAEVQVQHLRSSGLGDTGGFDHGLDLAAVDLDGYGALFGADLELARRASDLTDEGVSTEELGVDHVCTEAATEETEGGIRHILHGGQ